MKKEKEEGVTISIPELCTIVSKKTKVKEEQVKEIISKFVDYYLDKFKLR